MKELTDLAIAIPTAFPELFPKGTHDSFPCNRVYKCGKCGAEWPQKGNDPLTIDKWTCTVPTPIVIDWNIAHKVVRECDYYKVYEALFCGPYHADEIVQLKITFDKWLIVHATPADYLRAALEAKGAE